MDAFEPKKPNQRGPTAGASLLLRWLKKQAGLSKTWQKLVLGVCAAAATGPAAGQAPAPVELRLLPGPARLSVTDTFALGFRLRGAALAAVPTFPELEGLRKAGRRRTTTTRRSNGRTFSELTVLQGYVPYGEGELSIRPFELTVNGQPLRYPGGQLLVEAAAPPPLSGTGDLDQLFGKPKPALYQEMPDRAYLALEADRAQVFAGEGARVGLYFYLRPADQALLAFYDFDDQLPRLFRQLRQPTAWEVAAAPPGAAPDTVRRAGQPYLRFRLAESTYYPLTARPLAFPPLALTMTKFKVLRQPEPGQDNRLATYKTYLAPGLTVAVRRLPPAPPGAAIAAVPVGDFRVLEGINRTEFRTGESLTYSFGVEGRGNLAGVLPPPFGLRPGLEIYGPETFETPAPGGGRKIFKYRIVARRPGVLPLDSLLQLVVFNPRTARYDTLRPGLRPVVRGRPTLAAPPLPAPADDPFYGPALANASADLQPLDAYRTARRYAGWLLAGLLLLAGLKAVKS